jgi:hypothetical protein
MPVPILARTKKCSVCERNFANFFYLVIIGTLARSPKAQLSTKSIPVCDQCCNPKGGRWEDFKRTIAFHVWNRRADLVKKLEDANLTPAPAEKAADGKSAAAGQ